MFLVLSKPGSALHFLSACSHPTAPVNQVAIVTSPMCDHAPSSDLHNLSLWLYNFLIEKRAQQQWVGGWGALVHRTSEGFQDVYIV